MTKQVKADLSLVAVTLFWGASYYFMDISLAELETFNLNALRFLIAFGIACLFAYKQIRSVNKSTLKYAAILGFVLVFVYMGATYGVQYTSLSNAGFLCALTVVITPILGFFVLKQKPEQKLILAVAIALLGISLLTLNEELRPAIGDIFCIGCAFAYAVHLLIMESAVRKEEVDAFQLGVFQLGFAGLYQLIVSFLIETPGLPKTPQVWATVLVLSVFCTGLAFIVQALAQQYTTASHVGVIFTLEPVFAGFVAWFFAGEVLMGRAYLGAFLLLSSVFIMEADLIRIVTAVKKKLSKTSPRG